MLIIDGSHFGLFYDRSPGELGMLTDVELLLDPPGGSFATIGGPENVSRSSM